MSCELTQTDFNYVREHCGNGPLVMEFLRHVDLGEYAQYFDKDRLEYVAGQSEGREKSSCLACVLPHAEALKGVKWKKFRLRVYKEIFRTNCVARLPDLVNILREHEGFHAKEGFEDPCLVFGRSSFKGLIKEKLGLSPSRFKREPKVAILSEIRAVENELSNISPEANSPEYVWSVQMMLRYWYGKRSHYLLKETRAAVEAGQSKYRVPWRKAPAEEESE